MAITAQHNPIKTQFHEKAIVLNTGRLIACDPYSIEDSQIEINGLKTGEWSAKSALFVEGIDREIQDNRYFGLRIAITAHEQNTDLDMLQAIHEIVGGIENFYGHYSTASLQIEVKTTNGHEFLNLVNEIVGSYTPACPSTDIDQFKYGVLRNTVGELVKPNFNIENAKKELEEVNAERVNPQYAKVQYLHLRHKDAEFTAHDADDWENKYTFENSSGKGALFDAEWLENNLEQVIDQAEKLSVEYVENIQRNPINVKKVSTDVMGIATVTPNREHYTEISVIEKDGAIVEVLIHFDEAIED